ncbi:hypothetical protein Tco_0524185 [Tanacetum coccineum]
MVRLESGQQQGAAFGLIMAAGGVYHGGAFGLADTAKGAFGLADTAKGGIPVSDKREVNRPGTLGPFRTLKGSGPVQYKLEIPGRISSVHNTFQVSNLKKCLLNVSLVIAVNMKELWLDDKLNFVEEPVEIMDQEVKQLRQSRIPIVKVRWNSKREQNFTWDAKI